MKVNINFVWCDIFFSWRINYWPFNFFPMKGDCLDLFSEKGLLDSVNKHYYDSIKLKGCGIYEGTELSLNELFLEPLTIIIDNICWCNDYVELWIKATDWEEGSDDTWYWDIIDHDKVAI